MKAYRAILAISALFLLGCPDRPGSDADAGNGFLPEQLHGLPLVESESGAAAAGMITRLHQASIAPTESHIGVYAMEGISAALYVSRFASAAEADSQLSLMAYRIAHGAPGYGHFRSFDVEGTSVSQVFGNGQVHYFYAEGADLTWLAAAPPLARAAVAELMEVDVELIPLLATQPPNIIFIFSDDHASHAIGAYGSKINETPNIDRLAHEGMLFRNAFVTNSICAPSRAVILTGKHSHLNGILTNRERFDSSQVTFPKLLQAAGYQTAIIGKWHLKSEPTGFDQWEVLPGQGTYYNPDFRTPHGIVEHTGYVTDIITDKVLDWLAERRDPERPFLLMYQHKAPHRAWEPGPAHLSLYDDVTVPEPETLFDDYENRSSAAKTQEMTIAQHLFDRDLKFVPPPQLNEGQLAVWNAAYEPKNDAFRDAGLLGEDRVRWNYQRYIKDYLRTIASVDDNLGRLLEYLDRSGLAENTVIVYSSDQGFYLGDHGWYDKRWMYEESLRMPLIVRWPGVVEAGSENSDLVQNLDFAQTLLEIAGVEPPPAMQGQSLVPLLRGAVPGDWRDAIYYQYFEYPGAHMVRRHYGVRSARYKLIHYYVIDEWELFDLQTDPNELRSVHADPSYADVREELEGRLAELRSLYSVPDEGSVEDR